MGHDKGANGVVRRLRFAYDLTRREREALVHSTNPSCADGRPLGNTKALLQYKLLLNNGILREKHTCKLKVRSRVKMQVSDWLIELVFPIIHTKYYLHGNLPMYLARPG